MASSAPAAFIGKSTLLRSEEFDWEAELTHWAFDASLLVVFVLSLVLSKLWRNRRPKASKAASRPAKQREGPSGPGFSNPARASHETPPWRQAAQKDPIALAHSILAASSGEVGEIRGEFRIHSDHLRSSVLDAYWRCRSRVDWSAFTPEDRDKIFGTACLAAAKLGRMEAVEEVIQDMRQREVPRTQEVYVALLKLLTSKRQFQDCLRLALMIRDDRLEVTDRAIWSCLCYSASEEKNWEGVLCFFQRLRIAGEATEKDYGNAIRAVLNMGDVSKAFGLLDEMMGRELMPDVYLFNAVYAACCTAGKHLDRATELLDLMESNSCALDGVTYNMLIKGYVQAKRVDEAFTMVKRMESAGFAATSVTFGTLLDACTSAGDMDKALIVFQALVSSGFEMNHVLFTTLMKGFARQGRTEEALRLLEDMQSQGVEPDMVTYSTLLKGLCDEKNLERAFVLFESMCRKGVPPDEVVFNCLLNGCAGAQNFELGERLIADMLRSGIKPPIASVSTMLKLYTECYRLPQAKELLETMQARFGVAPEPRLYLQLTHAGLRLRRWGFALEVLRAQVELFGLPFDHEIVKLGRVCANFNMLEAVIAILDFVLDKDRTCISAEQFQSVINCAAQKRRATMIRSLMELAQKYSIPVPEPCKAAQGTEQSEKE